MKRNAWHAACVAIPKTLGAGMADEERRELRLRMEQLSAAAAERLQRTIELGPDWRGYQLSMAIVEEDVRHVICLARSIDGDLRMSAFLQGVSGGVGRGRAHQV